MLGYIHINPAIILLSVYGYFLLCNVLTSWPISTDILGPFPVLTFEAYFWPFYLIDIGQMTANTLYGVHFKLFSLQHSIVTSQALSTPFHAAICTSNTNVSTTYRSIRKMAFLSGSSSRLYPIRPSVCPSRRLSVHPSAMVRGTFVVFDSSQWKNRFGFRPFE